MAGIEEAGKQKVKKSAGEKTAAATDRIPLEKTAKPLKKRKDRPAEATGAPDVEASATDAAADGPPRPLKKGKKAKEPKEVKEAKETQEVKADAAPKMPTGGAPPEVASFKRKVEIHVSFKQIIKKMVKEVYPGLVQVNPNDVLRSSLMKFESEAAAEAAIAKGWVGWNNLKVQCRRPAGLPAMLPPHLREKKNALLRVGREEGQAPLLIAHVGWPRAQLAKVLKKNTIEAVFPSKEEAEEVVKGGQRMIYGDIPAVPSAAAPPANQQKHDEKKQAKKKERQEKQVKEQKKAKVQRLKEKRLAKRVTEDSEDPE